MVITGISFRLEGVTLRRTIRSATNTSSFSDDVSIIDDHLTGHIFDCGVAQSLYFRTGYVQDSLISPRNELTGVFRNEEKVCITS